MVPSEPLTVTVLPSSSVMVPLQVKEERVLSPSTIQVELLSMVRFA